MTKKEELIEKLKSAKGLASQDKEAAHFNADEALLDYINDEEVTKAYLEVEKYYS